MTPLTGEGLRENEMNEELLISARMNFENLERAFPAIAGDPYYIIAKSQLDEGLGAKFEDTLMGKAVAAKDFAGVPRGLAELAKEEA